MMLGLPEGIFEGIDEGFKEGINEGKTLSILCGSADGTDDGLRLDNLCGAAVGGVPLPIFKFMDGNNVGSIGSVVEGLVV